MKIGLIDVDGSNFPNIPLMKISAWHKAKCDSVEWYQPLMSGHMDKVYMSKVFSSTPDYPYFVDADVIEKGGSGYCIKLVDGKEVFDKSLDKELPFEIEHIYPDYSLYPELTGYNLPLKNQTAYGFLSRGCPRGCDFCHVKAKEGLRSRKVADLSEFWNGQKNIVLCDPNILACPEWEDLLNQLVESKAWIDINQGLDIRMMTEEKAELICKMKVKQIHFAWDRYEDKDEVVPRFKIFRSKTKMDIRRMIVMVLCNFNTTIEQDLERIYTLRELGFWAYIMIYNKGEYVVCNKNGKPIRMKSNEELLSKGYTMEQIEHFKTVWKIQRWVNNRYVFNNCERFEDYERNK